MEKHLEFASKYHTGTGVASFDSKSFEDEYDVILPSDPVLEEFERIGTIIFEQIVSLEKQIMILEKLKDLIQRKIVYGKSD